MGKTADVLIDCRAEQKLLKMIKLWWLFVWVTT